MVEIRGEVTKFYAGVIYPEDLEVSPSRKVIDNLFASRKIYEDENTDVMQSLVKLLENSLYRENIQKDIEDKMACKSEAWKMSEIDEKVED